MIVLLVGAGRGGVRRAGGDGPTEQGENSSHPSSVKGEAERHEAVLTVGTDGKPDGRHHTTQGDYEYKHSSQDGAFVFGALGFIAEADAGHGHEEQPHCWQTKDGACDHQGTSCLDIGWQVQDLSQGDAVVESCRNDTVCPGSPAFQLVHLLAGVQTVFTHRHPVVGGRRDHDAQPAEGAEEKAAQLETRVGHGYTLCVKTTCPDLRKK